MNKNATNNVAASRRGRRILKSLLPVVVVLVAALTFAGVAGAATLGDSTSSSAPWIQSDQADYTPGSTVHLTGGNWQSGETVTILTNDTIGNSWSQTDHVTADSSGNIADDVVLPNTFIATYTVLATGSSGSSASTTFTDGNATSVSGTVTDSVTHAAISGAVVTCTTASGCNNTFTATTDAAGKYVFSGGNKLSFATNGPVDLHLTASKTGYTSATITLSNVNNGDTLTGQDFSLTPSDTTPPVITPNVSGTLGSNNWYTSNVTVTWTVTDPESTVSSQTGCGSTTISSDTSGTTLTCSATSTGGTSSNSVTIKRDATAASLAISGKLSGTSTNYASGTWTNQNVDVSFSCTDGGPSGVDTSTVPANATVSSTTSYSSTCKDNAGNTSNTATFQVNIDKTAPVLVISGKLSGTSTDYSSGVWTNHNVDVSFSCTDSGGSGVDAGSVPSNETATATKSYSSTCKDVAGNTSNTATFQVNIDKTAPVLTVSAVKGSAPSFTGATAYSENAWTNQDVQVSFSCTDAGGSGVASGDPSPATVTYTTEGVRTASSSCSDVAGNSVGKDFGVKIDKTAPTFSCPGASDSTWHNANVTLNCTASDEAGGSGVTVADQSFQLSTTVANGNENSSAQTGTYIVHDVAGNTTTAGPFSFKVDLKGPSITLTTPPVNGSYVLNQVVAAGYSCSDGGSGLATCAGPVANGANIDTSSVGAKSFTVTATDNVGNAATPASHGYTVSYKLCLLYDTTKSYKAGSTAPIKIFLCDANGADVSSASIVVNAASLKKQDNSATGAVTDSGNANPDSNFRYDSTLGPSGGYIFNLSTKSPSPALGQTTSLGTGTWVLSLTVNGVAGYSLQFDVK